MGAIVVTVRDNGGSLSMTASPTGCGGCALADCRWKSATGSVVTNPADGTVTVNAVFASCTDASKLDSTRGSLSLATNGRNVMYWSPPVHNTQWIKTLVKRMCILDDMISEAITHTHTHEGLGHSLITLSFATLVKDSIR
jgi:hypothetical protein